MAVVIVGAVGAALSLLALALMFRTRGFLSRAQSVRGTVIEMAYSRSSKGGGGYAPVYQFMTADGQTIVKRDNLSTNPPRFQIGEELQVLYETDRPNKARINKWMNLYFVPALFGALGVISSIVAGVLALVGVD